MKYFGNKTDSKSIVNKEEGDSAYVPATRKVNNKSLSSDITLSASDVSAIPTTTDITAIVKITQATYNSAKTAGTLSATTLYIIVG